MLRDSFYKLPLSLLLVNNFFEVFLVTMSKKVPVSSDSQINLSHLTSAVKNFFHLSLSPFHSIPLQHHLQSAPPFYGFPVFARTSISRFNTVSFILLLIVDRLQSKRLPHIVQQPHLGRNNSLVTSLIQQEITCLFIFLFEYSIPHKASFCKKYLL